MANEPDLVWTLLASLLIGNTLLLLLNLPLAPMWAKLLQTPRPYLCSGILFFASLGADTVSQQPFDLFLLLLFGLLGFALRRFGIPVLPLILGVIQRSADGGQAARSARALRRRRVGSRHEKLAVATRCGRRTRRWPGDMPHRKAEAAVMARSVRHGRRRATSTW